MSFKILTALLGVLITLPVRAATDRFASIAVEATAVAPRLYALKGAGGNMAVLIGDDGVFIVDDQYAPLSEKIVAAIRKLSKVPIRFILNTHWHGDHTGGNAALSKLGAITVAHDNVRERMRHDQFDRFWQKPRPKANADAWPVLTFRDRMMFHLNGYDIEVLHVEHAHTDGDAIVLFYSKNAHTLVAVHMGDVFFNGFYPFIDYSTGGHIDGVIAASEAIGQRIGKSTVVIPGHGPVSTRKELRAYTLMLSSVRGRIRVLIDEGKSLKQIVAAKPTQAYDGVWEPKGFIPTDKWVEAVYTMLHGQSSKADPRP